MLPKIQQVFRLTRDPELRYSGQGTPICKVGLACSEKYGDKETQLFIDGTAFKKTAEMLNQAQKGHRVFVSGKINTESWESNGQKHSKIVMVIESFEFIEKRESQQTNKQEYQAPKYTDYQPQQQHSNGQQSIPDIDIDESIPF